MCDFEPGRVIISYHREDVAAREVMTLLQEGRIEHVRHIESMASKLEERGFRVPEDFAFNLHLVEVPNGQEIWKMNYLRFYYQHNLVAAALGGKVTDEMWRIIGNSSSHMLIGPDSTLSLSQVKQGVQFQFDAHHKTYKSLLGLPDPARSTGKDVTVAILDTGLDPATGIQVANGSRNFHDPTGISDTKDTNGHGTVVASIIHDLAPDARLLILKVGEQNPITEWNVLAALLAASAADIVNISLAFGMPFRDCPICGRRQTHSSRSAIFELVIDEVSRLRPETVIVSAAGNRQQSTLDFPARFGKVVAVGALDSQRKRPAYSNYGATDHAGGPHEFLFFAPGGGNGEYVASTMAAKRINHEGTSFAAPYVSALVALYRGQIHPIRDRSSTLTYFQSGADKKLPAYLHAEYGNGLIRI